ncbi:MAG: phenylacetate--CoA ligase family protein [Mogibacterium sp.]|nr:phenylacetate--CoA ligase family protein [Mogibacterium sp.]
MERSPIDSKIAQDIGIDLKSLSAQKLEEWQLAEIRKLLAYVGRSRFYRERLAGIDPDSIRTVDDFRKLPLTSESDLAGHENSLLCISPGEVTRMVTVPTTGTTGGSKRLAFTGSDLMRSLKFITVAYTTFMHEGDRMIVMMSGGTQGSIGDVVKHSMDQLGAETCIYGPVSDIRDAYEKVREWKPDVITGIPVQMAALARYCELQARETAEGDGLVQIREVLLSADDVPDAICDRLRRVWGSRVFRHFGMTELCIAGGCECCADMGYHLRHSDHYFEVIDPDEDGYGELAVTTFHHQAMPLLRYRTGDIGRIDRSVCACGSPLPRLIGPRGRISNSIPPVGEDEPRWSSSVFIRDLEEIIFREPAVIDFECERHDREISICLKHFPGDMPDTASVSSKLRGILDKAGISVKVTESEMDCFEKVYNSKKKIVFR